MPATFTTLRKGEILEITAHPANDLGDATVPDLGGSAFAVAGPLNIFEIISGETGSLTALISGENPGTSILEFAAPDGLSNVVEIEQAIRVLDADRFNRLMSGFESCTVKEEGGELQVRIPDVFVSDPKFLVRLIPVDERASERGAVPAYTLADGPHWYAEAGNILVNGVGAGTIVQDANVVQLRVATRNEDRVHFWALTSGTQALLSGEMAIRVITTESITLSDDSV